MAQYQSFPDASGDSRTLEKLKALRLPDLAGRSFLDVGCNEGFFCGFARFIGATRSVGIDHSAEFIYRAQARFPDCEFYVRDWKHLPEGGFDVILLASALHYADDQPALVRRLVENLAPNGVLILELGIAASPRAEWVKVKRGIDERYFPSMAQLKETLSDYAWKWMGTSVDQAGDPVPRHVIHVSRRRPVAYLLMQPPAYGKSSMAGRLFAPAGVPILSGDQLIQRIARNELDVSPRLRKLVDKDYSPFTIDKTVERIFGKKAGTEFVAAWIAAAGGEDFAFDGFVPVRHQREVETQLTDAGYMPVTLRWERVAQALLPMESLSAKVDAYNSNLSMDGATPAGAGAESPTWAQTGFIDEVQVRDGRIVVRGWAVGENGDVPEQLVVGVGAERTFVNVGAARERKDVQRHLQLPHAKVGYTIELDSGGIASLAELGGQGFTVTQTSGRPLRLAKGVTAALQAGKPP